MRVVVDTNIFVSAALKRKSLPNLALYQASQRCDLLKSVATEAQFFEVIARPCLAPVIRPEARDWLTGWAEDARRDRERSRPMADIRGLALGLPPKRPDGQGATV